MIVRVLLADDHPIVRQGLRRLLEAEADISVVGEVDDGLEAVRLVENLRPDLLIADLMMPGLLGIEVARQVAQRCPQTRVIILSMHKGETYILRALRSGALGYILKDTAPGELVTAIRQVLTGQRYISQAISQKVLDTLLEKPGDESWGEYDQLTNREREVLQLIVEGLTSAEIGVRLSISPRTVEVHRANLMEKLGLSNQIELVRYAIRQGIIPIDK